MTMLVSEILSKAADLLGEPGVWGQVAGGCHGNHCVYTAIGHVASRASDPRESAIDSFQRLIGARNLFGIFWWNDAPERTQAEVVAKLREAAEKALEQGQ